MILVVEVFDDVLVRCEIRCRRGPLAFILLQGWDAHDKTK